MLCAAAMLRILTVLLLAAGPALAQTWQARLTAPWPNGAAVERIDGREVSYPSFSPFSPAEVNDAAAPPPRPTAANATLYLPPGAHKPRSLPAVIMLHGSGGVLHAREHTYGKQFAAMGVAALAVDAFAARRDLGVGFVDRLLNITEAMLIADAFAGFAYLAQRPEIDPDRVVIAGFSYGAMATMYALNARLSERMAGMAAKLHPGAPPLRFAGHVAFYGPCIARFSDPRTTGAPLLMLYGTADELIQPERCAHAAEEMRRGGSEVRIVAYEGAPHQWDGGWGRRRIGRLMHGCNFLVERDLTVRDLNSFILTMSDPVSRRIVLGLCTGGGPYLIGGDDEVRAKSNREFGAFLARIFEPAR
jgi:dienelactone hydrolase